MDFWTPFLIAGWMLPLWLLGWLMLPLSRRIFVNLPDSGLAAGRVLAIAMGTLLAFWGASIGLLSLQIGALLWLVVPMAMMGAALRSSQERRALGALIARQRRALLWSDAVFLLGYGFFLWVRLRNPEMWPHEKPMDTALLAAAIRADWLPFDNPWLAGVPFTNYYYFGPLMAGLVSRTFATPTFLAYNLVQPLFCTLLVSTLWSLCAALSRSPRRGLWALSFVVIFGTFEPLRQMKAVGHVIYGPLGINWWSTSRVIDHTINEYPAFTLIIGDAHAHFYAMPLAALLLCLCWSLFAGRRGLDAPSPPPQSTLAPSAALNGASHAPVSSPSTSSSNKKKSKNKRRHATTRAATATLESEVAAPIIVQEVIVQEAPLAAKAQKSKTMAALKTSLATSGRRLRQHIDHRRLVLLLLGLVLGVQLLTNTWDVPLFALLIFACAWVTQPRREKSSVRRKDSPKLSKTRNRIVDVAWCALPVLMAPLAALPYLSRFKSQVKGVTWERWLPDAGSAGLLWGGILGLWLLSIVWKFGRRRAQLRSATEVPVDVQESDAVENEDERGAERMLMLVSLVGFLALAAPCVFYIKGYFGDGDFRRMDTVFKFGLQAWLLLGTAAACGVARGLSRRSLSRRIGQATLISLPFCVALLSSVSILYHRTVTEAERQSDGSIRLSLDGARFVPTEDRAAIEWLKAHTAPGESVIEAVRPEAGMYSYIQDKTLPWARVSMLSGVPSALGWPQHTQYWGADPEGEIYPRQARIIELYQWRNDTDALAALRDLKSRYVFVGALEHRLYPDGVKRIRQRLPIIYDGGSTFIAEAPR